MRILITGAGGSVGSALVRFFALQGHTVCAFDNSENALFRIKTKLQHLGLSSSVRYMLGSMRDAARLKRALNDVNWIVHCASYKHVDILEYNPQEAVNTNVIGAMNLLEAALESNVQKVIFTSSDKAVNPSSTMGATKMLVERLFIAANNQTGGKDICFSSVRFGNILGTNGSVLKIFKDCISNEKRCTITDPRMSRFFITLQGSLDLCQYALNCMDGGEIFVKEMGSTSILSLLKAYIGHAEPEYEVIGVKPGEKLYEELATLDEVERTVRKDGYFVIYPEKNEYTAAKPMTQLSKRDKLSQSDIYACLNSKTCSLSWQSLRELLIVEGLVS
jgi:UDP-N-acetylglucosamine 4,6-dehydratase